jgi:predicted O-linked N-acetylglucosamine transferase (SPINDLY family)
MASALKHYRAGRLDEAARACREILAETPDNAPALHLLGVVEIGNGAAASAIGLIERAIAARPDYAEAHNSLGNALRLRARPGDAVAAFNKAIELKPALAAAHNNLAVTLTELGRLGAAVAACRRAIEIKPDFPEAYNNLGIALADLGRPEAAAGAYRKALEARPDFADAYNNLGITLKDLGYPDKAVAAYRQAIAVRPGYAEAHNNMANALKEQGDLDDAVAMYRRAANLKPDHVAAHSNLLSCLNYLARGTARGIFAETQRWNALHARPVARGGAVHDNNRDPERRLRVGFVSPDFREHSVSHFFAPVFAALKQMELFCYSDVARPDAVTARLRAHADHWRNIIGLSDDDAADRVRRDRIDILVDLTGHTGRNRMLLFARRPAPVQVTWLGYANTTGLSGMDYRLTDALADPPGESDAVHSETLVRLPDGFLCYGPPDDAPDVAAAPFHAAGHVTFGSFNSLAKLTADVIATWARILQQVPDSRLLLKSRPLADDSVQTRVLRLFAERGIAGGRIALMARIPSTRDHLAAYGRLDIALDTFPYNGTATTSEALWMGVPVVALNGARHAARVSGDILSRISLTELAGESESDYVDIAVALAHDPDRLAALRAGLRERLRTSPFCDAARFAADLERTFRDMWRRWCGDGAASPPHDNHPDPDRPLKIGYLSPDLGRHPVGYFLAPVLANHDPAAFEVTCYSGRLEADDLTERLKAGATAWRDTNGVSADALAALIRADGIDILVDLAGHGARNRLPVHAVRPAPVQVNWLGNAHGTGRDAVDYSVMDGVTAPDGAERWFAEEVVRLPDGRLCYAPPEYAPAVARPPVIDRDHITFGCFNTLSKITPEVVELWCDVLRAAPKSRLVLKCKAFEDADLQERYRAMFAADGIDSSRLELRGFSAHRQMLGEYGDIDIALDPFPVSGAMTSCEALWMGVPVVTLPGERPVSRQTLAFLTALERTEWAAETPEDYVAIAHGLAGDANRLAAFRTEQRQRMAASPLCDGPRFTRGLEAAYRDMWRRWCAARPAEAAPDASARDPERRLRIGYVAPDFGEDSAGLFLETLLRAHDRATVEAVCYANAAEPDQTTRDLASAWHSIAGLSDEAVAERFRADRIDILVDLAAMEYRLAEAPKGESHGGAPARLPRDMLCYGAPPDCPDTAPSPVLLNGFPTFGSFDNLTKIGPDVVATWAEILAKVPDSRLVLNSRPPDDGQGHGARQRTLDQFAAHDIDPARIELLPWIASKADHLGAYEKIDVALDPFPHDGVATTCEALWMGVPVVSLGPDSQGGRSGAGILARLGLDALVAGTRRDYVSRAVALAEDPQRLLTLRDELRGRMAGSPLCDAAGFARDIEAAYRDMWRRWCAGSRSEGS